MAAILTFKIGNYEVKRICDTKENTDVWETALFRTRIHYMKEVK